MQEEKEEVLVAVFLRSRLPFACSRNLAAVRSPSTDCTLPSGKAYVARLLAEAEAEAGLAAVAEEEVVEKSQRERQLEQEAKQLALFSLPQQQASSR